MSTAFGMTEREANEVLGDGAQRSTQRRAVVTLVMQAANALWPTKPSHGIADAAGVSQRTAERWEQERGGLSDEALASLLRSEQGFLFLTAVMADAQPKWWRTMRALMECADIQQMQIVARRRLRRVVSGAINADADLSAAIARAEALCVSDEDFHRPHADAVRTMARVSDRAMATTIKRRRKT